MEDKEELQNMLNNYLSPDALIYQRDEQGNIFVKEFVNDAKGPRWENVIITDDIAKARLKDCLEQMIAEVKDLEEFLDGFGKTPC